MSWLFRQTHQPLFHDKAWKRADLAAWDECWAQLSVPARAQYLAKIKANKMANSAKPLNSPTAFTPAILEEWRNVGLIRDMTLGRKSGFVVVDDALGFTARLRAIQRYHLLEESPGELEKYINHCFAIYALGQVIDKIVEKQTGLSRYAVSGDPVQMFVKRRRWPEWVAEHLDDPLAGPVVAAIESAGGSLPLMRLPEHLPKKAPTDVRLTVDRLINHLALVEDLDPDTLDIVVGLLPSVLKDRQRAAQPVRELPLTPARPVQFGPEGGVLVPDLRASLLELAGQPPRLKQDRTLFQKEEERFVVGLDPLPDWLVGGRASFERVQQALYLANKANLTHAVVGLGEAVVLDLTDAGRRFLGLSMEEQYAHLFRLYVAPDKDVYAPAGNDSHFLGSAITAVPCKTGRQQDSRNMYRPMTSEERQPLRNALYQLFVELPEGEFFRFDDFLVRAATGPRNPLLLGGDVSRVVIRQDFRVLPPLEEFLDEAARKLLMSLLQGRLIPLGCVQLAREADNHLLMARLPRLAVYFGKAEVAPAPAAMQETRVVVQPDFSVIVIGLNPTPVADLIPFCERVRGRSSQGSLTFRISRESVLKALAAGLPPEQVMARLKKHASTPLPKNVATEVSDWCNWARRVELTPVTLLRCPDSAAADRVMGALGKHGERLGDAVVAIAPDGLTSALRQKLQGQGILLDGRQRRKKK